MTISQQEGGCTVIQDTNDADNNDDNDYDDGDNDYDDGDNDYDDDDGGNEYDDESDVSSTETNDTPLFNTQEYFSHVLHVDSEAKHIVDMANEIETLAHEVLSLVKACKDTDVLKTVKTHIQSSVSVLRAKDNIHNKENFVPTMNPAPNSNHEKQRRFFSNGSNVTLVACGFTYHAVTVRIC
jgi:hypothetical protein